MKSAHVAITAGITLALALGCSEGSKPETPPPAPPTQPKPTPVPEPAAEPVPAPVEPPVATTPDPARGATQYATLCASCHGPGGNGDGPVAAALDPKPARHTDGAYMNALSDEQLFLVIKNGGPAVGKSPLMASWGGALDDAQIRDVIAFIRTLADPPYTP